MSKKWGWPMWVFTLIVILTLPLSIPLFYVRWAWRMADFFYSDSNDFIVGMKK